MTKLKVMVLSGVICLLGATSALAVKYDEAPMLRVKVAAGELPPVEKRLPEEPVIVKSVGEIGQYGGTWRRVWLGPSDRWGPQRLINEGLFRWNVSCSLWPALNELIKCGYNSIHPMSLKFYYWLCTV